MRHRKSIKRLSRQSAHRKAVLRNQVKSLIEKEQIKTTETLAKESRRLAEKLITWGKGDTVAGRRHAFSVLEDRTLVKTLFSDIAPRFANRAGGYTRMIRLGTRKGDNAQLVILELTELKAKVKKEKKVSKTKKTIADKKTEVKKKKDTAEGKEDKKSKQAAEANVDVEEAQIVEENSKDKKGFIGGLRKFLKKDEHSE